MIVGGIEEVRLDETAHELYTADNYLGGRVMVFDLDTFKFKRGWGAYGHKLSEITTNDADRVYMPNGPFPKEFRNHLTLNFSNDGLMYEADRGANRIQVNKKDGTFVKEFGLATSTKVPPPPDKPEINTGKEGSAGGVGFSPDNAAEVPVHFRPLQQHRLVPQSRRRQGRWPVGKHGPKRRAVLRAAHDRRGFQRRHLHGRSVQRRARAAVRPGQVKVTGIICFTPTPSFRAI